MPLAQHSHCSRRSPHPTPPPPTPPPKDFLIANRTQGVPNFSRPYSRNKPLPPLPPLSPSQISNKVGHQLSHNAIHDHPNPQIPIIKEVSTHSQPSSPPENAPPNSAAMEVLQDYHGRLLSAPSERTDARTIEPGNGGREIGEKDVGSDHGGEPSPWTMGKMSILDLLAAVDEVSPTCSGDSDDGSDSGGEVGCLGSGDEESVETVNHRPQPEEYAALAWLGCRADIDGDGDGENEDEGDPFLELMINAVAKGEERRGGKTPSRLIFAMLRRRGEKCRFLRE